ncbi:MAG: Thiamine pyrophosphate TPP-binding domain-containing protein [Mesotoga prima]|uniref:Indolepyruvate oxidoreductase subunit IorA n=1 Tax=Mesotoga prima TaxID=1184387 RepID=A0A101HRB0_9BACT|nr:MAG: Thiamine pyrophosphate TPP-binding domain-containing protein [Mesotoga prima]
MKRMGDMLLSPNSGSEIMIGNTAIVRAMLEAGVRVVTSYPGSPTPEIAAAIASLPAEKNPMYFEFSVNEKVATEVAFGASVNGHLSCVFFKSVGINVAADTFVQLSLMELIGGMVIVLGDDPGANSSQNEQDNRHYAHLSYTPVLEPSTPSEAYSMFLEASRLSQEMRMPVIVRLSTHVCHAKEKVEFKELIFQVQDNRPKFSLENGPYIPITAEALKMKRRALKKLEEFRKTTEKSCLNSVIEGSDKSRGVITAGAPFLSLQDVLSLSDKRPDILKLGIVHPLSEREVVDFLSSHEEVKVLEELDNVIEKEVKAIAYDHKLNTRITGKQDIEDWIGEYTPDKVREVLSRIWPDVVSPPGVETEPIELAPRPAQMCPGCGHRSAFYAIKKVLHASDISVADIGCHTLGYLEPYGVGQVLLCMGHSSGTASGLSLFNDTRRVVAFLGDSTFFHAGLPGIVNAIFNKHNFTLIVMENGTTAMTGHQNHPAVGRNFREVTQKIPVRKVLEGLGVDNIREVDAYNQSKLKQYVEEALAEDGLKVIIAKHPCMLKFTRELRRSGRSLPNPVRVGNKCNRKYICVSDFACPSYQLSDDGSVRVQNDLCIGDSSCVQTCPSDAIASEDR